MAIARMRPRFEVRTSLSSREVMSRLRAALGAPDAPCTGSIFGAHAVLTVCNADSRYWSPQLTLDVEDDPKWSNVRVQGLFAPRPAVWTLFMALYAMLGFSGSMGAIVGLSQWSLGQAPLFLWSVPIAGVLGLIVYGAALTGQVLGNDDMVALRAFLDGVLAGETPGLEVPTESGMTVAVSGDQDPGDRRGHP